MADVTVTVTVKLPNRTMTETSTVAMDASESWTGPVDTARFVNEVAARLGDYFYLTLPEEWVKLTKPQGRIARLVGKTGDRQLSQPE